MSVLKELVYVGRDNAIRLELREDGAALLSAYPNLSPTRWVLEIGSLTFDSDIDAAAFDWDDTASVLELRLGPRVTEKLPATAVTLRMYSAEFPNGVVFADPTYSRDKLYIRICED